MMKRLRTWWRKNWHGAASIGWRCYYPNGQHTYGMSWKEAEEMRLIHGGEVRWDWPRS